MALRTLLFNIFINGLILGTNNDVSKFADGTQVGGLMVNVIKVVEYSKAKDRLGVSGNGMEFVVNKCLTLSDERNKPLHKYSLNSTPLHKSSRGSG